MKRVGIFAGSFDPIHEGHIAFALAAASVCGLDRVYFLPEAEPRHKQSATPLKNRLELLKISTKPFNNLAILALDDKQFSVAQTLPKLQKRFAGAKIYFLLGSDVLKTIKTWPNSAKLLETVELVCGQRQPSLSRREVLDQRDRPLDKKFKAQTIFTNYAGLSSSEMRAHLAKNKLPHGLPTDTHKHIKKNKLYGFADGKDSAK